MTKIPSVPFPSGLIRLWRLLMGLTRRHGFFTTARFHTRLFPKGQFVSLPGSAKIFVPPDSHFFGFVLGQHEMHVANLFAKYVKPGNICFDVGANIGYFAAMLAKLTGPQGEVFAFEPVPENFATLQINAEIAAQDGLKIRCVNAAVSDTAGRLRIVRRQWSTYHEVAALGPDSQEFCEIIPAVSLDDEILKLPPGKSIQMLKVDVEGHELPVLLGLRKSINARRVKRLIIEVTPGEQAARISELLTPHAVSIQYWSGHRWESGNIADLPARTDVFVEFESP